MKEQTNDGLIELNVRNLEAGMYILKVKKNKEEYKSFKFIKQ